MPNTHFECVRYYMDFQFGKAPKIVRDKAKQTPPADLWDEDYLHRMGCQYAPIDGQLEKARELFQVLKELAKRFSGTALLFIDSDNGYCTLRLLDVPLLSYGPSEGLPRINLLQVLAAGESLLVRSNPRGHLDIHVRMDAFRPLGPKTHNG